MDRRVFLVAVAGGLATMPLAARAQPQKVARVGFLGTASAAGMANRVEALRAGLGEYGNVEGKNLVIEFRWAEGNYDRLPDLAAELVRLKVDVLVTQGRPELSRPSARPRRSPSSWQSPATPSLRVSSPAWRGLAET
jgi:putative ABC transport system substrate-binding protein